MKLPNVASGTRALLAAAILTLGGIGGAAAFPDKPVEYIIPFGPGGESDIAARLQQPYFKKMFGQDLVISYKEGGGGAVGWAQLNGLNADGHTIMGINLPHIVIQPAEKDVGYKTDDMVPVYWFQYTPDAIVVPAGSEFKTLQDLIAYAKENPGRVTFSGSGKGTANHLAQVRFDKLAGIKTTYVPFGGTGPATAAVLGNQVSASWGYTTVGAAQGDQVRMLAVAMEERHPLFPDVPTFKELGFDMTGGALRGIAVPKGVAEEKRKAWSDMIAKINKDEGFRKQMLDGGFALIDVPYGEMQAFMQKQKDDYISAAKEAGILK
ncbi:tripartite tricarboxylate transporter substrate binding protein [Propylenella binzhouense]|uniref:Tripartite tricarboxylate transporter substrate binding protein n=1 Tax=Propylenella binzhouense TaxID=2555902 RepID=A0A964WTR8_9HYPH|nr:tripartite tricarboxylate transporter substrate binding protein [Propylenella binzhouense]MYZ48276.1 tripartite tricarboxylate transporter substrate binding protein [Propylenella binzhouense]